jgi:hypothetical protein
MIRDRMASATHAHGQTTVKGQGDALQMGHPFPGSSHVISQFPCHQHLRTYINRNVHDSREQTKRKKTHIDSRCSRRSNIKRCLPLHAARANASVHKQVDEAACMNRYLWLPLVERLCCWPQTPQNPIYRPYPGRRHMRKCNIGKGC